MWHDLSEGGEGVFEDECFDLVEHELQIQRMYRNVGESKTHLGRIPTCEMDTNGTSKRLSIQNLHPANRASTI